MAPDLEVEPETTSHKIPDNKKTAESSLSPSFSTSDISCKTQLQHSASHPTNEDTSQAVTVDKDSESASTSITCLSDDSNNITLKNPTFIQIEVEKGKKKPTSVDKSRPENSSNLSVTCSCLDPNPEPGQPKDTKDVQNCEERKDSAVKQVVESKKPGDYCKRYWGLALGILSSLIFSLSTAGVKLLPKYDALSIGFWRLLLLGVSSIIYLLLGKICQRSKSKGKEADIKSQAQGQGQDVVEESGKEVKFWKTEKFKLVAALFVRSTTGTISLVLYNASIHYMSLADATVLVFSTPVFVTFLAWIVLKEHCGVMNVLAAVVTFIGVSVIVRPPFLTGEAEMNKTLLTGVGMALGSMSLATFVYLCLRVKAVKRLNFAIITLVFGVVGATECAIVSSALGKFQVFPQSGDWIFIVPIGLGTFAGQACATLALKYEEAGIVSLTRSFDVVFAFLWEFLFLGLYPNALSLIGSAIILSGIFIVVLQKYVRSLPVTSSTRKKIIRLL